MSDPRNAIARPTDSWRDATVVLAGCLGLMAAIHYATVASILQSWSRDPLAHGYFVLPATACLAWMCRDRLRDVDPRPAFVTLLLIAGLSFTWLVGNLTQTTQLEQTSVILLFVALTWGVLGTAAARALMFPLGVLLFALPVIERVAPMLQEVTARMAVQALALSGVPAALSGNVIAIPGTRWHVSEACGGINYLTASLLVGYVYAGMVYRRWAHRVAFVAAAALTPIVGNLLRVYTTILLDYHGATGVASGMRHTLYGLLVFTVMIAVLFVTCGRWREAVVPELPGSNRPRRDGGVPPAGRRRMPLFATIAMVLIASGPASARILWKTPGAADSIRPNVPIVGSPWAPAADAFVAWTPPATGRSASARAYRAGNRVVHLHVASYGADEATGDLVSGDVTGADSRWWPTADRHRSIGWRGENLRVREIELRSAQESLLVWYWYVVNDQATGDDYRAKLLLARERFLRRPQGGDRVVVFTRIGPDADAVDVLEDFVSRLSMDTSVPAE